MAESEELTIRVLVGWLSSQLLIIPGQTVEPMRVNSLHTAKNYISSCLPGILSNKFSLQQKYNLILYLMSRQVILSRRKCWNKKGEKDGKRLKIEKANSLVIRIGKINELSQV